MPKPALTLHLPGGVPMTFQRIPPGAFRMGSRGVSFEEPIHVVRIAQEFWLGETPVTQAQFGVWTAAEGIQHENRYKGHPDHPAENMDWREAVGYCAWLTMVARGELPEGWMACLPTETEWEYACRAGTETEYYGGDGEVALTQAGWFGEDWEKGSTHPVGLKRPNWFGLYDLHGNVFEWCHDAWEPEAYRDRVDGDDDRWAGRRLEDWVAGLEQMKAAKQSRVQRGGSWAAAPGSAARPFARAQPRQPAPDLRVPRLSGPRSVFRRARSAGRGGPGRRRPRDEAGVGRGLGWDFGRGTRPGDSQTAPRSGRKFF